MPSIFTHAFVPLAIAVAAGRARILALAGVAMAMLPDADVISFRLGIDYGDTWGHRGATHALAFAALCGGVLALVWEEARSWLGWVFLTGSMASHGLLDTLTDGGLGAALLWPVNEARLFAPVTPIRVSPIGAGFFSARGAETLVSEFKWVWLPCVMLAAGGLAARRAARPRP